MDMEPAPRGPVVATPEELRDALNRVLLEALRPVTIGLALLYGFFAIVDPQLLPFPHGRTVGFIEALIAVSLVVTTIVLRTRPVAPGLAHPIAAGIALAVLLETGYTIWAIDSPLQTTYLVLLEVGAALFFLHWGWLLLILASTTVLWTAIWIPHGFGDPWLHYGLTLLSASVVAVLVHATRLQTYRRLEGLRIQDARQRTDLQAAVDALRQSETRFRSLSDATSEGIVLMENGRIVDASDPFSRMFQADDAVGRNLWDFLEPEARPLVAQHVLAGSQRPFEAVGIRRGTERFPVEITIRATPFEGRTANVLAIRDITERKKVEEANRLSLERLMEIERLREVNQFKTNLLNTASHELNTPLTALRLQLHMLEVSTEQGSPEKQRHAIEVVQRNVQRLSDLVQDVVEVARLQSGRATVRKQPVDLTQLLIETRDSFQALADKAGVALDWNVPDNLWGEADARRLSQVFFNLLSNAIKFTPKGGHVKVMAERLAGEIRVSVEDTGRGINAQDLSKLFQPFSQVHDPMEVTEAGTGLGLFICKGIVENHGGRIWAESDGPGKGSRFAFTVPA